MRVLFVHQNFPGQFRHVAAALSRQPGTQIAIVTDAANKQQTPNLATARYRFQPSPIPGLSNAATTLANRFRRGELAAAAMLEIRKRGFIPDVVVGHPGWGELMLVKEVFPTSELIAHAEYYYTVEGGDVGFDPEFPGATDELRFRLKAKNLPLLAAVADSKVSIAPTAWQASRFPVEVSHKIEVIHEGIRTDIVKPDASASYGQGLGGKIFRPGDEVVTFVNRNLEPMRGFHIFMRALPRILAARPNAHVVIVGGDGVSYGPPPTKGLTWKSKFLAEVEGQLPMDRIHFVGQIPYSDFVALMQVSRLHIYATYPFVLSWSMLEAMSAGALVLGSATPPVTEMIEHTKTGLLYDFFDVEGLATSAIEALADPERHLEIRKNARRLVTARYDLALTCLPAWLDRIKRVADPRS